jgi:hypothetical protein
MSNYIIYTIINFIIIVTAQPLYKHQLHKLPHDNINLIFQQRLNETFNNVYNNVLMTATKNLSSYVIFDSPFCVEPTKNYYNIISQDIIINYYEQKKYYKYKLLTKYEYQKKILNEIMQDYSYNNHYKSKCPFNTNDGYIIWSYDLYIFNSMNEIIRYNNYDISINKIKKYVKYFLNKINFTFPDSNIDIILNIELDPFIDQSNYIYSTNCCPKYNISF